MAQLVSSNLLTTVSFALVIINAFASIWRFLDRRVLIFINFLLYVLALIYVSKWESVLWFGQEYFISSTPHLTAFVIMVAATGLFFLELNTAERVNGPLFASIFLVLNLSLLFSTDLLKTAVILILFEVLELLVLSNTRNPKESMLRDLALTKIFSVISLSMATVFIIISRDSVSLFEANILNYNLYYLGVCFFVIYLLSIMYIPPLDEIKGINLLNSSDFSVTCSVLSKFIILGTVLISILKRFILAMEPSAQEGLLSGLGVVIFIAMISLLLKAMNGKNKQKITYYLFCMNNIHPLFSVYGPGEVNMRLIFFLLALSSLGLFVGLYVEKNSDVFIENRSRGLIFIFYLLGIMTLWGAPTTVVFKVRYLLTEQMLSFDMTAVLLIIFMLISGLLWYPIVISIGERLKNKLTKQQTRTVGLLEVAGLFWVSIQIIILNYSNFLIGLVYE